MPISLISLVDLDRVWFKSCSGASWTQTHRNDSLCSYVVMPDAPDVTVIADTSTESVCDCMNLQVTDKTKVRFYAGAAIVVDDVKIGALCVVDIKPHPNFSSEDKENLIDMAGSVAQIIRDRRQQNLNLCTERANIVVNMMHSLRTPMTTLNFASSMLELEVSKLQTTPRQPDVGGTTAAAAAAAAAAASNGGGGAGAMTSPLNPAECTPTAKPSADPNPITSAPSANEKANNAPQPTTTTPPPPSDTIARSGAGSGGGGGGGGGGEDDEDDDDMDDGGVKYLGIPNFDVYFSEITVALKQLNLLVDSSLKLGQAIIQVSEQSGAGSFTNLSRSKRRSSFLTLGDSHKRFSAGIAGIADVSPTSSASPSRKIRFPPATTISTAAAAGAPGAAGMLPPKSVGGLHSAALTAAVERGTVGATTSTTTSGATAAVTPSPSFSSATTAEDAASPIDATTPYPANSTHTSTTTTTSSSAATATGTGTGTSPPPRTTPSSPVPPDAALLEALEKTSLVSCNVLEYLDELFASLVEEVTGVNLTWEVNSAYLNLGTHACYPEAIALVLVSTLGNLNPDQCNDVHVLFHFEQFTDVSNLDMPEMAGKLVEGMLIIQIQSQAGSTKTDGGDGSQSGGSGGRVPVKPSGPLRQFSWVDAHNQNDVSESAIIAPTGTTATAANTTTAPAAVVPGAGTGTGVGAASATNSPAPAANPATAPSAAAATAAATAASAAGVTGAAPGPTTPGTGGKGAHAGAETNAISSAIGASVDDETAGGERPSRDVATGGALRAQLHFIAIQKVLSAVNGGCRRIQTSEEAESSKSEALFEMDYSLAGSTLMFWIPCKVIPTDSATLDESLMQLDIAVAAAHAEAIKGSFGASVNMDASFIGAIPGISSAIGAVGGGPASGYAVNPFACFTTVKHSNTIMRTDTLSTLNTNLGLSHSMSGRLGDIASGGRHRADSTGGHSRGHRAAQSHDQSQRQGQGQGQGKGEGKGEESAAGPGTGLVTPVKDTYSQRTGGGGGSSAGNRDPNHTDAISPAVTTAGGDGSSAGAIESGGGASGGGGGGGGAERSESGEGGGGVDGFGTLRRTGTGRLQRPTSGNDIPGSSGAGAASSGNSPAVTGGGGGGGGGGVGVDDGDRDDTKSTMSEATTSSEPTVLSPGPLQRATTSASTMGNGGVADEKLPLRVLIVEDTLPVQKLLRRWMEKAGCKVTCASNGKIGLGHLTSSCFDIAFVDFLMVGLRVCFLPSASDMTLICFLYDS
jgi:hypothetical protein